LGAHDYLVKPVEAKELTKRLGDLNDKANGD
jgi:DNA-binding response OmpR family regulator